MNGSFIRGIVLGALAFAWFYAIQGDAIGLEARIEITRAGWLPTWSVLNVALHLAHGAACVLLAWSELRAARVRT